MKNKIYFNTLVIALTLGFVLGCSSSSNDKAVQLEELKAQQTKISKQISELEAQLSQENPEAAAGKAKEVTTAMLTSQPFDHYVQTQGWVEAEDDIAVSAKSMGVVTQVFVKEGDNVVAGQTLAQIDNSIIIRGIEELKSQLNLANTVFERQRNLWEQKIGTEVQFLQAKANKEALESRLASLNEQNDMARIKSPIKGVVDDVMVKVGQNIAPGLPAVRVVNLSSLKLKANVSEAYVTNVKEGNKVYVNISELKKEIIAKVTFVSKTIDPLSRTFTVEIALPSDPDFRPNMTGVVKIVYKTEAEAIVVPINIIQSLNDQKVLYVAENDGTNTVARKRVVIISEVYNSKTSIKSGVTLGEKIITFGYQGLSDGQIIKI